MKQNCKKPNQILKKLCSNSLRILFGCMLILNGIFYDAVAENNFPPNFLPPSSSNAEFAKNLFDFTIEGPASVCPGSKNKYHIETTTGQTNFMWEVPSGWEIISGQGSIEIEVLSTTDCNSTGEIKASSGKTISNNEMSKAKFEVTTATPGLQIIKAENVVVASCDFKDQDAANKAFADWLATAKVSGGCSPESTPDNTTAPDFCGGETTVIWTITDKCYEGSTYTATYKINAGTYELNVPENLTLTSCQSQSAINAAYAAWLDAANSGNGCPLNISNNAPKDAPSTCGGSVTVEWTATGNCTEPIIKSATFTVPADTEAPTFSAASTIQVLYDASCGYSVPLLEVADNCGAASTPEFTDKLITSYSIAGSANVPAAGIALPIEVTGIREAKDIQSLNLSFTVNQGVGKAQIMLIAPDKKQAIMLVGPNCTGGKCDLTGTFNPVFHDAGFVAWNTSVNAATGTNNYTPNGSTAEIWSGIEMVSGFDKFTGNGVGTWQLYAIKQGASNGRVNINSCSITFNSTCAKNKTIERTWTSHDECGNTSSFVQTIVVTDNSIDCANTSSCPHEITTAANSGKPNTLNAMSTSCQTQLSWNSDAYLSVKQFVLEHSSNGINFKAIQTIPYASGNNYQYTHSNPVSGNNFYRIKFVENSGDYSYSAVAEVKANCGSPKAFIYPNPVVSQPTTNIVVEHFGNNVNGYLYNAFGSLLKVVKLTNATNRLDLSNCASGVYLLKVYDENDNSAVIRIVVTK